MNRAHNRRYLIILFLLAAPAFAQGIITTIAGGTFVFRGDGGPATAATLGGVFGAAVDPAGNVYATDRDNSLVIKIAPNGTLTVLAGNGFSGFGGDGVRATSASLSIPIDLAVDAAGNLYIAEAGADRVRKLTPDGIITTVAGGGRSLGDGGPATGALLVSPTGIAFDSAGNLYIAEAGQNRVRRVSPNGIITTVAGNAVQGFSGDGGPATSANLNEPATVAVDPSGILFIADTGNNRIRRVNLAGSISTVAGGATAGFSGDGGPASSALLNTPTGGRFDASGNFYFAESRNGRIRKISVDRTITTIAGDGSQGFSGDNGPALAAALNRPDRVAVDALGNLYIGDYLNNRLRRVDGNGVITTLAGSGGLRFYGDGGPGRGALLNNPGAIALAADGAIYIADTDNHRVRKLSDGILTTVAGDGVPRYLGDGGPALNASLSSPSGLAFDSAGNLYVADAGNNRIRKITPDGLISTAAGDSAAATLNGPAGVAVDAAGNLYIADTENHRIRKTPPAGASSTLAGTGSAGFAGDNGPAAAARLNRPTAIALDSTGAVYISDTENNRVRKISANGAIATIAGNGSDGFSGDGGPATAASLWAPSGLFFDAAGVLHIVDRRNNRIRAVNAAGVISTVAGRGPSGFSGDGGPASQAVLSSPTSAVFLGGDLIIADAGNNRIRAVLAAAPTLLTSSDSLTFSSKFGGPPTAEQNVTLASSAPGIPYTISLQGDWLFSATPLAGTIPATAQILVDPDGLAPGTYNGTVTISSPVANPPSKTVAVSISVDPGAPPKLAARPDTLSYAFGQASPATSQTLNITNDGSGLAAFTASARTTSGGWLSVAPASGTANPAVPIPLTITANPAGLAPGTYTGQISLAGAGSTLDIPVTMTVTAVSQTILLSQTGMTFTAVAGGGSLPSQNFGILNIGRGVMQWSASVSTLSGGANWLSVTPSSGASDASSLDVPLVDVAVNPAGLDPGDYYGQVRVSSDGADNSPQYVAVVLNVLPAGSDPGPIVRPTGLIFTGAAGQPAPASQSVLVANVTGRPASFTSGRIPQDPAHWFVQQPVDAAVSPNQPTRIVIQPNIGQVKPGFQRGTLTLQFADGSARTIALLLVIGSGSGVGSRSTRHAEGCAPTRLFPVPTSLGSGFNVPAAWPVTVEARVVDDCGGPAISGSVVATFSSGDPPLSLVSLKDGRWTGTWQARNTRQPQVTIGISATDPTLSISGSAQFAGSLQPNAAPPLLDRVVSSASLAPQAPLAPGGLITILGTGLSGAEASSADAPLPTELAGTQVAIAGNLAPLFSVGPERIQAVLPYGIGVNTRYQILVQQGSRYVASEPLAVASAQPAIFSADNSGKGQGLIYSISADGSQTLADAAAPAKAGDSILIRCSGLGAVDPPVAAGAVAPDAPSRTVNAVSVSIGGQDAPVSLAGLLPGSTGVYQIQVKVPGDAAAGGQVPVVVTIAGQTSPVVTMALTR